MIPVHMSASRDGRLRRRTRRRILSSASATLRRSRNPLALSASVRTAVNRSSSPAVAGCGFSDAFSNLGANFAANCGFFADAFLEPRISSYKHTATACPKFIEIFCVEVGTCSSQLQWLKSSLVSPNFSEPKSSATRFGAARLRADFLRLVSAPRLADSRASNLRMIFAASSRRHSRWCNSRWPTAVVPTTSAQSATASATLSNSSAFARTDAAPTAERASRYAGSYGFTTRRCENPKLLIARAAAPMFKGLRVETSTTRRLSELAPALMRAYSTAPALNMSAQRISQGAASDDDGFLVFAEGAAEGVGDFADRGVGFDGGQNCGHQVFGGVRAALDLGEGGVCFRGVAAGAQRMEPRDLRAFNLRINAQRGDCFFFFRLEAIHADDDLLAGIHGLLIFVG